MRVDTRGASTRAAASASRDGESTVVGAHRGAGSRAFDSRDWVSSARSRPTRVPRVASKECDVCRLSCNMDVYYGVCMLRFI